ncbi:hypothetical protein PV11_03545 [Exophiala sideris]|uniref:Uncharacterized protein n=1 Tax=Exophiala sideris TaxID=1016849 RepID=A0A0D1YK17_9EURO|nr:hypothetical protein PV11_03545 [Exophiala sideris]
MEPYDPVKKYGSDWKDFSDGSTRRVVIYQGRYCFQIKGSQDIVPIANAITPPPDKSVPRALKEKSRQQSGGPGGGQSQGGYGSHYPGQRDDAAYSEEEPQGLDFPRNPVLGSPPQSHDGYVLASGQPRSSSAMRAYDRQHDNQPPPSSRALQTQSTQARSRDLPDNSTLGLSDLALEFARIPLAQPATCRRFVDDNRDILDTNPRDLLAAAVEAQKGGDHVLSLQCIQRSVILRSCRDLRSQGRADYFRDLAVAGSNASRDFYRECQRIQGQIGPSVQAGGRSSEPVGGPQSNTRAPESDRYGTSAYPAALPIRPSPAGYQASYPSSHQPSYPLSSPPSYPTESPVEGRYGTSPAALPTDPRANYGSGGREPVSVSTAFPGARGRDYADDGGDDDFEPEDSQTSKLQHYGAHNSAQPRSQGRDSKNSEGANRQHHGYTHTLPTAHGGKAAEFRGQFQPDLLNESYKLRRDVERYFISGRIFAMVWAESMGLQHNKTGITSNKQVNTRFKGGEFHTTIRRMVVIRQRKGYCVCVPISSYGGRGVKPNMPPSEKQAHAIIYDNGRPTPSRFSTEPEFEKRPIAADMHTGETLTASSRIHFGRFHTVDYNVKVKDIGRIADRSKAEFDTYWRQELLGHR